MIQSFKQIKNRIRSVENTKKITSAMEMISVAKLNRVDKLLHAIRPYFGKLESIMQNIISSQNSVAHPLLTSRPQGKICLSVITSDSGLCGTYNTDVLSLADEFIEKNGRENMLLVCIGRKGFNYFRKSRLNILNS